jgi:polyhydroxyalkanoate synthesis regulator phasin
MSSSLIPERPLLVSPSLAATIGLEEACMLSLLSDIATYAQLTARDGMNWLHLDENLVSRVMPFWVEHDIQRISKNLRDKGIIILDSAPYVESRCLTFAFNEAQATPKASSHKIPSRKISIGQGANLISPHWQPDGELLKKIAEHNIPADFIREQIPEFVIYWSERGETNHSWGAKFLQDLLHKWRNHQTQTARQQRDSETDFIKRDQEIAMYNQWRPSQDALEVLVKHASISLAFVEDAIPEFVLYWQERGDVGKTWNSKFIQHVKRQWIRYNSALEHDTEPRRIPDNWQPSNDLFDVLRLANIDMEFAKRQVAEFLLFWRDSNQLFASWNTKFLQHVKFHWAKQHALTTMTSAQGSLQGNHHAGQQLTHPTGRTRDRSLAEQLNDRSWAK